MKHIMPNETEQLLDLGKPSLEALSYSLRHCEMWPAGFGWDYSECHTCAMGLAINLWNLREHSTRLFWLTGCEIMQGAFNIPKKPADNIFCLANEARGLRESDVTPEMVADDIDAYLASRS